MQKPFGFVGSQSTSVTSAQVLKYHMNINKILKWINLYKFEEGRYYEIPIQDVCLPKCQPAFLGLDFDLPDYRTY